MKRYAFIAAAALALSVGCDPVEQIAFEVDGSGVIETGPDGGVQKVSVKSSGNWIASTDKPWISVSPANGIGSAVCEIRVDSSLVTETEEGIVRFSTSEGDKRVTVTRKGYELGVSLDRQDVSISNYGDYGTRYFDIDVTTNVGFDVVVPDDNISWIKYEDYNVNLDRGVRPRTVKVRFNWEMNSVPDTRVAEISFVPKDVQSVEPALLKVTQGAAPKLEPNRAGDSTALINMSRILNVWEPWDPSVSMNQWSDIKLWEEGDEGWTEEKDGRVKYARFYVFSTNESLPYDVQQFTAAEELVFYSNDNKTRKNLHVGEYLMKLSNLKRLTMAYFGLVDLPEGFAAAFPELEYLNLSGNNFQTVPSEIDPDKMPKLRTLILNSNYRNLVYDLSNATDTKNLGGFYDEEEFPTRLLKFKNMDTLSLSVNYLHGELPESISGLPVYDVDASEGEPGFIADSLRVAPGGESVLDGTPVVLPDVRVLRINNNRFTGSLPKWILYHPRLDYMDAFTLIFQQEGMTPPNPTSVSAGFDNVPLNMDYYYEKFPNKGQN